MKPLDSLLTYFHTGTAEGDKSFLADAFVTPSDYAQIVSPPPGSPRVLVGKKGSGKTAAVQMIRTLAERERIPVLLLRPDDMVAEFPATARDIATLKRSALAILANAIAAKLGQGMNGHISEQDAKLFQQAVKTGIKSPDKVQRVLQMLMPIGKAASGVDWEKMLPSPADATPGLLEAIKGNLENSERVFFLLIDDTDQIAAPDVPDHLNRIWAFLLAARALCTDLPNLRCIVTLRSEVWTRLQSERAGQRDQVDHFRPLVLNYNPTDAHLVEIFGRRIDLAWQKLGRPAGRPMSHFFEGDSVRLPRSEEQRAWSDFLIKNSRERPRDLIQFVGTLAKDANEQRRAKIRSDTVDRCSPAFSEERARDVAREVETDCPEFLTIIESFAELPWQVPGDQVEQHLGKLPSAFSITLRGTTLQPDNRDHLLRLWGLLYEVGFLNPVWPDARQPKGFRHGAFREDPNLVSLSNYQRIRTATWEVHPAYRSYLMKRFEDSSAKAGVTRKPPR